MHILLTNDDGILSPGLHILRSILETQHEVWTIAPDTNRSGCSASIHLDASLKIKELAPRTYSCSGTPVDCVLLGMMKGFFCTPDFVVSGMNLGQNLGGDIWHSGTVSAARQAAYYGIPSIAFSLVSEGAPYHFDAAKACISHFFEEWVELCEAQRFLNVNIPNQADIPFEYKMSSPMMSVYDGEVVFHTTSTSSWIAETSATLTPAAENHRGDRNVVASGMTSVSVLSADAIGHASRASLRTSP